ncbi:MAG: ATP-binding protein [Bacteroidales bacterium]|nr:ATP-binding protein [Bacteroidales bacterium]
MELFREKFYRKLNKISLKFKRNLLNTIHWENRMIGIRGARGVGKTTLILQYIKGNLPLNESIIYISLDDIYFTSNSLSEYVDDFVKKGGKYLFIDEVHKYKNWSIELKNIYDNYADLKIVFTGSSILPLIKSKADLSRRAIMYDMQGLSFREFLNITHKLDFESVSLPDILSNHTEISMLINNKIKPILEMGKYNEKGYYPYFIESNRDYLIFLAETINQTLEADIPIYLDLNVESVEKMKKLLFIISTSVPFKPNISKLSETIGITRNTLKTMLHYLYKANIINLLFTGTKGISILQKPEKIYLHHPNLMYALSPNHINIGTLRETFFYNQLQNLFSVKYTNTGDFLVDDKYTFEIGGKNKTYKQIKNIPNSYIVADNIEYGAGNKIPLFLFGFLY